MLSSPKYLPANPGVMLKMLLSWSVVPTRYGDTLAFMPLYFRLRWLGVAEPPDVCTSPVYYWVTTDVTSSGNLMRVPVLPMFIAE